MASVPIKAILCLQLLYIRIGAFCVIGTDGISWDMEEGILRKRSKNRREFDYFKLSYLWPGTACRNTTRCCSCNACCRSKSPFEFTIHGLWPYNNDGTRPTRCSSNFDKKEISPLLRSLRKYWSSYNCEAASTCHWAHEWEKHGTCSYPVILDEFEYFTTTLKVYHAHNVTGVLSEAGYKPSNSEKYPLTGITFAIQNAFHLIPELKCSGDAVKELRICFSKDFQPRDCASASFIETGRVSSEQCPRYVRLPAYDRSWGNKQMAGISWKLFCAVHFLLIFTLF